MTFSLVSSQRRSIILLLITAILSIAIDRLPRMIFNILPHTYPFIYTYGIIWLPYGHILSHAILGIFVVHWSRRIHHRHSAQIRLISLGMIAVLIITVLPYIVFLLLGIPEQTNLGFSLVQIFLIQLSLKLPAMIIAGTIYWYIDRRRQLKKRKAGGGEVKSLEKGSGEEKAEEKGESGKRL